MSHVTRTEITTKVDTRPAKTEARARCSTSTNCRCGQQLDMCARAHCPRCGRSLGRR
jgi:hypothetical protein